MWSWALQTDSLDLAGSKKQGMIIAIIVLIINVVMSVCIVRKGMSFARAQEKRIPKFLLVPVLLCFFAFVDFMVAWLPAVLWIGPQGRIDSVLPLGSASLLLMRTPFVFASRLVGFYGLAAFVWTTVYLLINKKNRAISIIPILALGVLSLVGWAVYKNPGDNLFKATLVSETLTARVSSIKTTDETLVVFPEYGLEGITNKNLHERIVAETDSQEKTFFIGSSQVFRQQRNGHENRMQFGNTTNGFTDAQDKYRLIPGGEDLPYIVRTALRATGQKGTLDYFSFAKAVIKGHNQLQPLRVNRQISVGAAVCSSIIAPQDYRDFANQGATVFVNAASLKPFNGSRLFAWQQQSLGRFMAVANSRYFLQSANSASAYAYDNNGRLLGQRYGVNTLDIAAQTNASKTFYTQFGELMAWAGGIIFGIIKVRSVLRSRNKKNNTDR